MRSFQPHRLVLSIVAALGITALSSAANADSGSVYLTIFKGGWVIGGSAGVGTLSYRGRIYALSVGGIDYAPSHSIHLSSSPSLIIKR